MEHKRAHLIDYYYIIIPVIKYGNSNPRNGKSKYFGDNNIRQNKLRQRYKIHTTGTENFSATKFTWVTSDMEIAEPPIEETELPYLADNDCAIENGEN